MSQSLTPKSLLERFDVSADDLNLHKECGRHAIVERSYEWLLNYRNLRKNIRPKILRRQIFLRYGLPQICPVEDVNFEAFDRVTVFTKSRIAFNRLRKNANSTAMIALTRFGDGATLER